MLESISHDSHADHIATNMGFIKKDMKKHVAQNKTTNNL